MPACHQDSSNCNGCSSDSTGKYSILGEKENFWSSSQDSSDETQAWGINFSQAAIVPVPKNFSISVRCVKGSVQKNSCYPNPCGTDVNSTGECSRDGIKHYCVCKSGAEWTGTSCNSINITECSTSSALPCKDSSKNLIWSYLIAENKNWEEAKTACSDMVFGGFDDWRLPNIDEIRTLIRECPGTMTNGSCELSTSCVYSTCTSAACDGCTSDSSGKYSKLGDTHHLWSSTESWFLDSGAPTNYNAMIVNFATAAVASTAKTNSYGGYFVRCVRSAE